MGGKASAVRVSGPLASHVAGFRRELERLGYKPNALCDQLRLMAHVSRWLEERSVGAGELTPARVDEFLARRRAEGYTLWLSTKDMVPMLDYLRGLGVVQTPTPAPPATEAEQLQEHYRSYLVQLRGLAVATVASYLHVARLFVSARAVDGELHLDQLDAVEVTEFVLAECATRSVGSAKYIVCGLRSLLRYLYVAGHTDAQLERCPRWRAGVSLACPSPSAVPRWPACWRAVTVERPSAGATTRC